MEPPRSSGSSTYHTVEMLGDVHAPDVRDIKQIRTPPLRTYSRRNRTRRATSSPKNAKNIMVNQPSRISSSLPEIQADNKRVREREPSRLGRKRMRLSVPASLDKSPTDLFFEHMSSSVPLLATFQQSQQDNVGQNLERHVPHSTSAKSKPIMRELDGNAFKSLKRKAFELEDVSDEDHETVDDSDTGDAGVNDDPSDTDFLGKPPSNSSVKRYRLLCVSEPSGPKNKTKPLYLAPHTTANATSFRKLRPNASRTKLFPVTEFLEDLASSKKAKGSRPRRIGHITDAFGGVTKPSGGNSKMADSRATQPQKASDPTSSIIVKAPKAIHDGFTNDEAQNTPPRYRERRNKTSLSDVHLKGLDITQKEPGTQKVDGPTWLRGQKKHRSATPTSFLKGRRCAGTSHSRIEIQDPLEADGRSDDTQREYRTTISRSNWSSRIISDEEDEEFDLLRAPKKKGDRVDVIEQQREAAQQTSDADEPVDLLSTPNNDFEVGRDDMHQNTALQSTTGLGLPGIQLLPKRRLNIDYGEEPLALRPSDREWLR